MILWITGFSGHQTHQTINPEIFLLIVSHQWFDPITSVGFSHSPWTIFWAHTDAKNVWLPLAPIGMRSSHVFSVAQKGSNRNYRIEKINTQLVTLTDANPSCLFFGFSMLNFEELATLSPAASGWLVTRVASSETLWLFLPKGWLGLLEERHEAVSACVHRIQ